MWNLGRNDQKKNIKLDWTKKLKILNIKKKKKGEACGINRQRGKSLTLIYTRALWESLLWQCRGFGTRVLYHRGPVVACKPSLWPHLLQSSNLFTVQLTSLLFCFSFPSQNSSVFLGFRVLSWRFLLAQIRTSLNFYSFSFFFLLLNHCHAF